MSSLQTRIGCREILYCSEVGSGVEWRRFGSRIPLENRTNRVITSSSVGVHDPMYTSACVSSCNSIRTIERQVLEHATVLGSLLWWIYTCKGTSRADDPSFGESPYCCSSSVTVISKYLHMTVITWHQYTTFALVCVGLMLVMATK